MTPTRLRGWMKKYGDWGRRWRKRLVAAPAMLLLPMYGMAMFHPPVRPPAAPTASLTPASATLPAPPDDAKDEPEEPTTKKRTKTFQLRSGRDTWRFEAWEEHSPGATIGYILCFRNGVNVQTLEPDGMHGNDMEFGKIKFKSRYPILVTHSEPAIGHPGDTRLYTIHNRRLVVMVQVGGMYGGPIFHDYDGDGRPEWVFDDYNYYRNGDWRDSSKGPQHYLVYKQRPDGTLKLWKTLPNKRHWHLPSRLGAVGW